MFDGTVFSGEPDIIESEQGFQFPRCDLDATKRLERNNVGIGDWTWAEALPAPPVQIVEPDPDMLGCGRDFVVRIRID